jgi:hypothetical protein
MDFLSQTASCHLIPLSYLLYPRQGWHTFIDDKTEHRRSVNPVKKRPLRSHHLLETERANPIMALLPKAADSREAGYIYANCFVTQRSLAKPGRTIHFLQDLARNLVFQHRFGQQLLQSGALGFQFLHSCFAFGTLMPPNLLVAGPGEAILAHRSLIGTRSPSTAGNQ